MIRSLALFLVLILGVALAAVTQIRMSHLRAVLPADRLPGWTQELNPDAGFLSGSMRVDRVPGATFRWRATAPGGDGLHWRVTLQGGGLHLAGDMVLPFGLSQARLTGLTGAITLQDLPSRTSGAQGVLQVRAGTAVLEPLPAIEWITATLDARVLGAAFDSTALGEGTFRFEMDPLGSWRVALSLTGGSAEVDGNATGRRGLANGGVTATITDTGGMPEEWQNALSTFGQKSGRSWTISQTVPWRALLSGGPAIN